MVASATMPPPAGVSTTCTTGSASQNSKNKQEKNVLFGVVRQVPRGGGEGVEQPSTLSEVEALILKASAEQKLVVIDFTATWCGPCQAMAPLFGQLAAEFAPQGVVFLKVDVDDNADTAAKYQVSAMPTFLFLKGGQVVDRLMGANPDRLRSMIQDNLS
eukprot:scaffold578_cov50-Attheya_sp.AAC.2